jgi:hypothetical protein
VLDAKYLERVWEAKKSKVGISSETPEIPDLWESKERISDIPEDSDVI